MTSRLRVMHAAVRLAAGLVVVSCSVCCHRVVGAYLQLCWI